jgi:hypothetical protein
VTSSWKCFPKAQRGCVPEIAKVVLLLHRDLVMCKGHPGVTGFEVMKGSRRASEARHCERPWKAIGAASIAIEGSGLKGSCNVLEMSVPWDDHQEQQQWSTGIWSLEDNECDTMGMAGEVTQDLVGAQKIVSWIPHIGWLEIDFCFWLWQCPDIFPLEGRNYFSGSHS